MTSVRLRELRAMIDRPYESDVRPGPRLVKALRVWLRHPRRIIG